MCRSRRELEGAEAQGVRAVLQEPGTGPWPPRPPDLDFVWFTARVARLLTVHLPYPDLGLADVLGLRI